MLDPGIGALGSMAGNLGVPGHQRPQEVCRRPLNPSALGSPETNSCVLGEGRDLGLGVGVRQTSSTATLPLLTLVSSLFHAQARLGAQVLGTMAVSTGTAPCIISLPLQTTQPAQPSAPSPAAWCFSNARCRFLMG